MLLKLIKEGQIEQASAYITHNPAELENEDFLNSVFSCAVEYGHLDVVRYLSDNHSSLLSDDSYGAAFCNAALNNRLEIMQWLVDNYIYKLNFIDYEAATYIAAYKNHRDIVEWLNDKHLSKVSEEGYRDEYDKIALSSNLNIAQIVNSYKYSSRISEDSHGNDIGEIALNGHSVIVKNIVESYSRSIVDLFFEGLYPYRGSVTPTDWLLANQASNLRKGFYIKAFESIADDYFGSFICGNIDKVKWLIDKHLSKLGKHSPQKALYASARGGNIDVFEWLINNYPVKLVKDDSFSCSFNKALESATRGGHIKMVQWILDKYSPEENNDNYKIVFGEAVDNGHIKLAKWSIDKHSDSLKLSHIDLHTSVINGHLNMIQWLVDNGIVEVNDDFCKSIFKSACCHGQTHIVKWLCGLDAINLDKTDYEEGFKKAAEFGCFDTVIWLSYNHPSQLSKDCYADAFEKAITTNSDIYKNEKIIDFLFKLGVYFKYPNYISPYTEKKIPLELKIYNKFASNEELTAEELEFIQNSSPEDLDLLTDHIINKHGFRKILSDEVSLTDYEITINDEGQSLNAFIKSKAERLSILIDNVKEASLDALSFNESQDLAEIIDKKEFIKSFKLDVIKLYYRSLKDDDLELVDNLINKDKELEKSFIEYEAYIQIFDILHKELGVESPEFITKLDAEVIKSFKEYGLENAVILPNTETWDDEDISDELPSYTAFKTHIDELLANQEILLAVKYYLDHDLDNYSEHYLLIDVYNKAVDILAQKFKEAAIDESIEAEIMASSDFVRIINIKTGLIEAADIKPDAEATARSADIAQSAAAGAVESSPLLSADDEHGMPVMGVGAGAAAGY